MKFDQLSRGGQYAALMAFCGSDGGSIDAPDQWFRSPGRKAPIQVVGEGPITWDADDQRVRLVKDPNEQPKTRDKAWLVVWEMPVGHSSFVTGIRLTHEGKRRLFLLRDLVETQKSFSA